MLSFRWLRLSIANRIPMSTFESDRADYQSAAASSVRLRFQASRTTCTSAFLLQGQTKIFFRLLRNRFR